MKPNKYNPQIPRKNDGQAPAGWVHADFPVRVTIDITPMREEVQLPQMISSYFSSRLWAYHAYPFFQDDYEVPYQNTIEALELLMPGKYVIVKNRKSRHHEFTFNKEVITLYCESWIDPVVIKLADDPDKPNSLMNAKVEYRNVPPRCVTRMSSLVLGMVDKACYNESSENDFPLYGKRLNGFFI